MSASRTLTLSSTLRACLTKHIHTHTHRDRRNRIIMSLTATQSSHANDHAVPLVLRVHATTDANQWRINSNYENASGEWHDIYVSFSGHFGKFSPHLFAAAPDMERALRLFLAWCDAEKQDNEQNLMRRVALCFDAMNAARKAINLIDVPLTMATAAQPSGADPLLATLHEVTTCRT